MVARRVGRAGDRNHICKRRAAAWPVRTGDMVDGWPETWWTRWRRIGSKMGGCLDAVERGVDNVIEARVCSVSSDGGIQHSRTVSPVRDFTDHRVQVDGPRHGRGGDV